MSRFENAKPGDRVILGNHYGEKYLHIIAKVGKVHIVLEGSDTKYRRESGRRVGDSYHAQYISPFSQEKWDEYLTEKRLQTMRCQLRDFTWHNCDAALVRSVHAMLPPKVSKDGQS